MDKLQVTKTEIAEIKAKIDKLYTQLNESEKVVIEMVAGDVSAYLAENKIDSGKYKFLNASYEGDGIEILLCHDYGEEGTEEIDEDFSSDKAFDRFLRSMAEKYGVKRVKVPYWYYSK